MLRFLNELNNFRKSIDSASVKRPPTSRCKSHRTRSQRRNKTSRTPTDLSTRVLDKSRSPKNVNINTQSFVMVEPQIPLVSRKNSKRKRNMKTKLSARSKPNNNKQNQPMRSGHPAILIQQDMTEKSSPLKTNSQLVNHSLKMREEIKTLINKSYVGGQDFVDRQTLRQRFTKVLIRIYNCLSLLPVINEQCVMGTIGEKMYYFLGVVLFRMVNIRKIDLTLQQFLKQCQPIYDKSSIKDIEDLLNSGTTCSSPQMTKTEALKSNNSRQFVNVSFQMNEKAPPKQPTRVSSFQTAFEPESYLMRQATSIYTSSATKTDSSMIKQSHRRETIRDIASEQFNILAGQQCKIKRKESHHFDKDRAIEEEGILGKLNDRLEQYIAKHQLRHYRAQ